ncbi:MAG: tetratricopeptide repeat protein, partial [Candidatus Omnitrophica bacterium]|nr:tetratricopeptide repeat protein [Candidatus Omnitrophota bacterium]
VWTNMHGFFFFGPLIVFLGIVSEWIKRHVRLPYEWNECGRLNDSEYQRLKFVFIVVVLGCLLNPQFAEGALYPLTVFFSLSGENSIFFDYIQELQKPITWSSLFDVTHFIYFKIMILVSFASFIFCRRRIDISALILWIIFLIFSLKAMRNMPFFAFAAYLVFVTNLMYISSEDVIPIRFSDPKFLHLTSIIGKLFLTLWILAYFQDISVRGYYDFDKHERKSEFGGVSQRNFPNKAVDFLVEHNIKGNFFNDFNSGAYLIGRAWPNIKVFIDGRTEVYGGEFFKFYQKIWDKGDGDVFEEAVGRYKITGVFLNSIRQHIPEELLRYLYTHEDWKVVYFDYDGMIFLKDIPVNRPIIDQYEIDLTKWEAQEEDLLRIGATKVKPFRNYYRAFTLDALDLYGPAMAEAQAAIKLSPSSANVYKLIGQIYAKQKRFRDAFEYFRAAAVIDSDDQETRYNLARAYLDMEEYDGAVKQYEIIRDRWPSDPRSWFVLSKAYAKNKKYIKAYDTLVQALHMKPGNIGDAAQIGDVVFEDQQYKEAILFYSLLLKINPNLWEIHQKIGQAQEALGDIPAAKNAFRMALSINPENENLKKTLTRLEHISRGDQ